VNQRTGTRFWVVLGVGIAVIAGLGSLLALLGRGPGDAAPVIAPALSTPTEDPVVASVAGRPIRYSVWMEAVSLDQVMSGMAGPPAPTPNETLQRLINADLVLQTVPPEQAPTAEQVKAQISAMEQMWGVDDTAVVAALEKTGLTRAAFERAVERSLAVQAGLQALQNQGHDPTAWLEAQRASTEIVLNQEFENESVLYIPIAQSPIAMATTSPIPTPVPAPDTPLPTPPPAIPQVAPDFTLERAGGGTINLTQQLAEGPVVLVFFRRGG
jgi:hypothetical protein